MRDVNSHSLQKVRTDRHSVSLHCLFPLTFSGFFGFLGFFFPKKNPKRSARRSLAYALFPMPGRRARSPGNNVSLRGVGQRFMRPLLQKICTDIHSVALPRLFHLPFFGFFGFLGFFFTKKNPKRSARRSLAYALFPMSGCGVETPHNPFLTAREARIGERLSEQHPKIRRSQARGARRRMPCPDRCCQDSDGRA